MRAGLRTIALACLAIPETARADVIQEIDQAVREALGRIDGGRHDDRESRTRGRGAERGFAIGGTGRDPRTLEAHGLDQLQEDRRDPPVPVLTLAVTADATDGLYRALGWDPYAAEHRDRAIRDAERIDARAAAQREADLATALADLPARLLAIWTDESEPLPARRALVFALWDECADDTSGALARSIIEAFVRIEAPEGTALAYSDPELRRLDAVRESREPFQPYQRLDPVVGRGRDPARSTGERSSLSR